ncbi:MAG: hypothetical protein KJ650_07600 [Firmicutes bacterium]|jgi:hypothetical protein|nr:hypothetical protein [Bacillota bacterium]MBV1727342.1 hypothetical protein [Desulforudis sp.]MDQ7789457.1 hypothetical protein [Clostridia bacterium]MBU4533473.1 hypothetical protein [Bacillota bacterium]MBU4554845.1 hypothetical protein [Bacillota bacterium]
MIGATLRIKNKTIIVSILLLLLGIIGCVPAGPGYLMGQARAAQANGDQARAVALYDRVLKLFPWNEYRAGEALYWSAQVLPGEEKFEAYIFAGASPI